MLVTPLFDRSLSAIAITFSYWWAECFPCTPCHLRVSYGLVVGVVGPEYNGYGSTLLVVRFIPRRRSCAMVSAGDRSSHGS